MSLPGRELTRLHTLCLCCLVFFGQPASGHRLAQSVTELDWRVEVRRLEVTHSIHLDDAIPLLLKVGGVDGDLTPDVQAKLLYYVEQRFELAFASQPLALEPVGAMIDGDYLWIYQELELAHPPDKLRLNVSLLQDFHLDQQNLVNFKIGDQVRTLRFDRDHQSGTF